MLVEGLVSADEERPSVPSRLAFHWIKSNQFRVVHADGAEEDSEFSSYLNQPPDEELARLASLISDHLKQGTALVFCDDPLEIAKIQD